MGRTLVPNHTSKPFTGKSKSNFSGPPVLSAFQLRAYAYFTSLDFPTGVKKRDDD